jgi:hypothetical protein
VANVGIGPLARLSVPFAYKKAGPSAGFQGCFSTVLSAKDDDLGSDFHAVIKVDDIFIG